MTRVVSRGVHSAASFLRSAQSVQLLHHPAHSCTLSHGLQALCLNVTGDMKVPENAQAVKDLQSKRHKVLRASMGKTRNQTVRERMAAQLLQSIVRAHQAKKHPITQQ